MINLKIHGEPSSILNGLFVLNENVRLDDQIIGNMFRVEYPGVIVEASGYSDGSIAIFIIKASGSEITNYDWSYPYSLIRCFDIEDFYIQLQRALDLCLKLQKV